MKHIKDIKNTKNAKNIKLLALSALLTAALAGCAAQTGATEDYIGNEAAKTKALQDSGIALEDAVVEKTSFGTQNGIAYYEVDFTSGGYKYEYDIDALTGVVIESKSEMLQDNAQTAGRNNAADSNQSTDSTSGTSKQTQGGTSGSTLTKEQAREAALGHAGLDSEEVTFVKTELDWEDGRQVYEVEFYSADHKEYDYEIDAATGEVIAYDYDAENYNGTSAGNKSITADEAKNIALSQVKGATLSDIYEFETDYDDGRLEYEGKIYYSGMEYEFTIDGYSGSIREWEAEPI